jgi:hypothetical protein
MLACITHYAAAVQPCANARGQDRHCVICCDGSRPGGSCDVTASTGYNTRQHGSAMHVCAAAYCMVKFILQKQLLFTWTEQLVGMHISRCGASHDLRV